MKKNIQSCFLFYTMCILLIASCKQPPAADEEEQASPETPVQVSAVIRTDLSDEIMLNATSAYLEKSYVKSTTNGYVEKVTVQIGADVHSGQLLFSVITKEARAIGNSINALDPGFKFSGISNIRAERDGYVTQVNHQKGDYVQDGEAIAVISNRSSLVFLLDLPYEMRSIILNNKTLEVLLPDGEQLVGRIMTALPAVDSLAQTQRIVVKVNATHPIPENLIGKVRMVRSSAIAVQALPRSAVLTNETEDVFWVMKMINDSTAVKTIVKKGMEDGQSVQIISPVFRASDRLVTVGNYGLADTAKVKIVK
jgi:biotin carboxyl carrier protein